MQKLFTFLLPFPLVLSGTLAVAQVKPKAQGPARKPSATSSRPQKASPAAEKPVILSPPSTAPLPTASSGALFEKGTTMVNLGLGLGNGYSFGHGLESTPALSLSAEKGVLEGIGPGVIGVGGMVGYKGYHYQYLNTDRKATWNTLMLLARGTYHYDLLHHPKLDTYLGVSVGARIEMHNDRYDGNQPQDPENPYGGVHLETGVFAGGRYFLTKNFGAFAEVGYDMTYLKLGLTGRF